MHGGDCGKSWNVQGNLVWKASSRGVELVAENNVKS